MDGRRRGGSGELDGWNGSLEQTENTWGRNEIQTYTLVVARRHPEKYAKIRPDETLILSVDSVSAT